jgi:hypothetical protein
MMSTLKKLPEVEEEPKLCKCHEYPFSIKLDDSKTFSS